jgi:hypothetical protein
VSSAETVLLMKLRRDVSSINKIFLRGIVPSISQLSAFLVKMRKYRSTPGIIAEVRSSAGYAKTALPISLSSIKRTFLGGL